MLVHIALLLGLLSPLYIKPEIITHNRALIARNYFLTSLRICFIAFKKTWLLFLGYLIFSLLVNRQYLLPALYLHGCILLLSFNRITPIPFMLLTGLIFSPYSTLVLIPMLWVSVRSTTPNTLKDNSSYLVYLTVFVSGLALVPTLTHVDLFRLFPLNRIVMLVQFVFASQLTSHLTNSKDMVSRLKSRFHIVRLRTNRFTLCFLPSDTQTMIQNYATFFLLLITLSFLINKTILDHGLVIIFSFIMMLFEFDLLFYHVFNLKQSNYRFTLVRKGSELVMNYLCASYIMVYGLMEATQMNSLIFTLFYTVCALLLLCFFMRRTQNAFNLKRRVALPLVALLLILSACSKDSKPDEFIISITTTAYFGKLEPKELIQISLQEIEPRIKESSSVKKGTSLYRDLAGNMIKARYDGHVDIQTQTFQFVSESYECRVIIPEIDLSNFRIGESYPIESIHGDALASVALHTVDYQYSDNEALYHEMNHFRLIFSIDDTNHYPQSVILKVPQPIISIPSHFIDNVDDTLWIETVDGRLQVDGPYDSETNTYEITTRLPDGLVLYEVYND